MALSWNLAIFASREPAKQEEASVTKDLTLTNSDTA